MSPTLTNATSLRPADRDTHRLAHVLRSGLAVVAVLLAWSTPARAACVGDCDGGGSIGVDELVTGVNIALWQLTVESCRAFDADQSGTVSVDELVTAVNGALNGCADEATPTPTTMATCERIRATVMLAFDPDAVPDLAGLTVDLNYPSASVDIPGSGSDTSVLGRVMDVSGASGLSNIIDHDTDNDQQDDQLSNTYVTAATIHPGAFEEVLFDCQSGVPPLSSAFNCAVSDPVDSQGFPVEGVTCEVAIAVEVAPTATIVPETSTPSPTATPTSVATSSPTTTGGAVCGNHQVEAGETCDDGNTTTDPPNDTCPADCTIVTCTTTVQTLAVLVSLAAPANADIESMTVILEYPDGTAQIPGTKDDDSVAAAVTNTPSGFLTPVFDYNYALSIGLAGSRALTPGALFNVTFSNCSGAGAPGAAAFKCTVRDAANGNFEPVAGVTCSAQLA